MSTYIAISAKMWFEKVQGGSMHSKFSLLSRWWCGSRRFEEVQCAWTTPN